jgi:hypothetical protein
LDCGIEVRSYSIPGRGEFSFQQLLARSAPIAVSPVPYDPAADLVSQDIRDIPSVLAAIDKAWGKQLTAPISAQSSPPSHSLSLERIAGAALAASLVQCMAKRITHNLDTIDLLIAGVEVRYGAYCIVYMCVRGEHTAKSQIFQVDCPYHIIRHAPVDYNKQGA